MEFYSEKNLKIGRRIRDPIGYLSVKNEQQPNKGDRHEKQRATAMAD